MGPDLCFLTAKCTRTAEHNTRNCTEPFACPLRNKSFENCNSLLPTFKSASWDPAFSPVWYVRAATVIESPRRLYPEAVLALGFNNEAKRRALELRILDLEDNVVHHSRVLSQIRVERSDAHRLCGPKPGVSGRSSFKRLQTRDDLN